jgi:SAM-dependent methyltransferase
MMGEEKRAIAREVAYKHLKAGDPLSWFEDLYSLAGNDTSIIPWADLTPNPNLIDWLERNECNGSGKALKVGCGLGDDAEELTRRGFETTAFDISASAIAWCRKRYPQSFYSAPTEWKAGFHFVLESYTLQVLPPNIRADAVRCIASFVAPGGTLLVVTRGKELSEPEGKMPWPLTKEELSVFKTGGLKEASFEDYMDGEDPPVRRFRATYQR